MSKSPLTEGEIRELVGEREIRPFLNTRNELYRERKMGQNPPTREEAVILMGENPNLIKRPLLVEGDDITFGFVEDEYRSRFQG